METSLADARPTSNAAEDTYAVDRLAFDRTAPERAALNVEHSPQYSLDAFYAAGKARWIVPKVLPFRERMLRLPEFDIRCLDNFEDYARAIRFVQTVLLRRIQRARQLPAVANEGWRIRGMMMSYAESLSYKGLIAPELIVRLREGSGYRDLVEDLTALIQEFEGLEAQTGPEAPVTKEDMARAFEIADEINLYVGNGADVDLSQTTLLEERRKLGGLLLAAHSEIRRGMTFLRWKEGDVLAFVPSLHVPPGSRKTPEPPPEVPEDIAALHEQLHAAQATENPAVVHPEDNPFAAE